MYYVIIDYELCPLSHKQLKDILESLRKASGIEVKLPTETRIEVDEEGNEVEVEVEIEKEWTIDDIRELLAQYPDVELQVLNEPPAEEGGGS